MQKDLRTRNKYFDTKNIYTYLSQYAQTTSRVIRDLKLPDLEAAMSVLFHAKRIFVAGNGGSSSISDHLCCDFEKGAELHVQSLVGRPALISAIANDIGYDDVFSFQLEAANVWHGDVVILISSSGNSPNIIKAAECALNRMARVIGLTGFDGGQLKKIANVSLHIDANNYGVIEDCHQMLMHILAQYIYLGKNGSTAPNAKN